MGPSTTRENRGELTPFQMETRLDQEYIPFHCCCHTRPFNGIMDVISQASLEFDPKFNSFQLNKHLLSPKLPLPSQPTQRLLFISCWSKSLRCPAFHCKDITTITTTIMPQQTVLIVSGIGKPLEKITRPIPIPNSNQLLVKLTASGRKSQLRKSKLCNFRHLQYPVNLHDQKVRDNGLFMGSDPTVIISNDIASVV